MSNAVLDAGPSIHLSELQALDVLRDLDVLFVPSSVWEEVAEHQPDALTNPDLNLQKVSGLVRAVRKGHRSPEDVLSLLSQLHNRSTLFIKQSLISNVIRRLEKEWLNH
ncbi:hypothetical protein FBQ81_12565 [Chloroflexi bacterium CFX6]|nr:hypothetical protein [Chloroflexi bacterium CFX6]